MIYKTKNPEETIAFGQRIGSKLNKGMCIALQGDLGAGKTTFTKGVAKALHITKEVNSPTFTIMKIYEGDLPLYHIDAYRLEGLHQDLGFEEYIQGDGVSIIEWPNYAKAILPNEYLEIRITYENEHERTFELEAHGTSYETLLGELQ